MYNAEQKQKYIDAKLSVAKLNKYFLPKIFERSEPFEEELGKDVSNFTTEEIENMYRTLNISSPDTMAMINSAFLGYTNWCMMELRNVEDSQNHFMEFDATKFPLYVNKFAQKKKIVDREQILEWTESLLNPRDQFVMLALFEGIKGDNFSEITSLKEKDIDVVNNTINVHGRGVIKYSPELCRYADKAAHEYEYYPIKKGSDDEIGRIYKFLPTDDVVKSMNNGDPNPTEFRKGRRIYTYVMKIYKMLGVEGMNPNDLYYSGLIYFINQHAIKLGISGKEFLYNHRDELKPYYIKEGEKPYRVVARFEDCLV